MELPQRWADVTATQRTWLFGVGACTAVGLVLAHHWLYSPPEHSRRGRMKRSNSASPNSAPHRRSASAHSTPPDTPPRITTPSTPTLPVTPGNDGPPLYPYEPHNTPSPKPSHSPPTQLFPPSPSYSSPSPPPPLPSSRSAPTPSSTLHQRVVSISNEEPREQLFYDLLSITAGGSAPSAASTLGTVSEDAAGGHRTRSSPPHSTSLAASALHSASSAFHSPSVASSPTPLDPQRVRALQHKWQREQRRRDKLARRLARTQLDAVSTASPSPSFSSASSMSLDSPLDGLDDPSLSVGSIDAHFDYESQGEELKEEEAQQQPRAPHHSSPRHHHFPPQRQPHSHQQPLQRSPQGQLPQGRREVGGGWGGRSPVVKRLNGSLAQQPVEGGRREGRKEEEEVKR